VRAAAGEVLVPGDVTAGDVAVPGDVTAGDVGVPVWPGVGVAPVAVAPGAAVVVVGATAAGAVVTVVVAGDAGEPESPASLTRAAAITPSDSAATTASAMIGAFQLGDVARRVRAAAPQRRHHSWSEASGAPHSGQASALGAGRACGSAGAGVVAGPATLKSCSPAGG
jgi:hypothetical protein